MSIVAWHHELALTTSMINVDSSPIDRFILHLKVTHSFSSLLIDKNFSILGVRRDESHNKIHNSHLLESTWSRV